MRRKDEGAIAVKVMGLKDPVSALTHIAGAGASVVGLVALIWRAAQRGTAWHLVSFAVFGASLILLYTASSVYHSLQLSEQATLALRKVDHMMIFVLIAGSYTPFTLVPLRGIWGWSLFGAIWGCAAVGMGITLFWMGAPRWLSTAFYILMGWLIIIAFYPLSQTVAPAVLFWLVAGGILYTLGAILYATKWPNPWPGRFGFHEIWHLFVIAGSAAHFAAVWQLI